MKYQIVSSLLQSDLENHIAQLIAVGWRPLGGVAVVIDQQGQQLYVQALVKGE
ncbi:MAG: DUF1737 domain-containing protein [Pyrinomonadaceae bacterium]